MIGSAASLGFTFYLWRNMPWKETVGRTVDWNWIANGLKKSHLIWLGSIALAAGTYVDRFVVERTLTLSDVGVITFYSSFTTALSALMQSGVLAFSTPLLIKYSSKGEAVRFRAEARHTMFQVATGACVAALLLAIAVPSFGYLTHHATLVDNASVLWLMLLGTWIRAVSEVHYNVLYAVHRDRPIWLGNLLFLIPAVGGNALLVRVYGIEGAGYASILAGAFLFFWRRWHVQCLIKEMNHCPTLEAGLE